MTAFQFRPYQEGHVQKGVTYFERKHQRNEVEVVPTGGGKSWIIGGIATNLSGKTLVLQPSKEILAQNFLKTQTFLKSTGFAFGDYDLGVYSASFGMRQKRRITFATIGSIFGKREEFADFDRIIMDECDLVNAQGGQYEKFFDELGLPVLGLTDSPYRLHRPSGSHNSVIKMLHRTRPRFFKGFLNVTQNRELFDAGYLTKPEYIMETFHSDQLSFNTTGAEFTDESVKKYSRETNMVDKMARYTREIDADHVLAVCNDLTEARDLHQKLQAKGTDSLVVHGEMKTRERDQAQHDFKSGRQRIAIVCGMWTVGFDFPDLDCVIDGKITNSARLFKQTVGRGVRLPEDKTKQKRYRYVSLGGSVERFGKVEEFDIVGEPGKERLKSDVGFLTGVDLKTRYDIEAGAAAIHSNGPLFQGPGQPATPKDGQAVAFGKYKGQQISAVPVGYLIWMRENMTNWNMKKMAIDEIHRRNMLKAELQHGV